MTKSRTKIIDILKMQPGVPVLVKGWVRTKRGNKKITFIALNDGSTIHNVQVVCDMSQFKEEELRPVSTGACLRVEGLLVPSLGTEQSVEIQAREIEVYGTADPAVYPLQKKGHSMEFLREIAHLRPRTNTFGCVLRIRHAMAYAIHKYFNDKGFVYLHTPIITASDCEGAGAMFQVTTLDMNDPPKGKDGQVDYSQDFFGRQTSLTVSGQLEGELGAMALGEIYTFGPTFRAENSNTPRHLAEFWMIEPEVAFADLNDNADLAEDYLKFLFQEILRLRADDLKFFNERIEKGLLDNLNKLAQAKFIRITYTEAISLLEKNADKFDYKPYWGIDLQSEHERYLAEVLFKGPVIVMNYPKEIKAFYMRLNDDQKTVAAMDVLLPTVGEIIGGSQREERLDILENRIREIDMSPEDYWWYCDLRRFGTVPHAGFGLGFERMVRFCTGMANIRDVIPFPRTPQSAEF